MNRDKLNQPLCYHGVTRTHTPFRAPASETGSYTQFRHVAVSAEDGGPDPRPAQCRILRFKRSRRSNATAAPSVRGGSGTRTHKPAHHRHTRFQDEAFIQPVSLLNVPAAGIEPAVRLLARLLRPVCIPFHHAGRTLAVEGGHEPQPGSSPDRNAFQAFLPLGNSPTD